MRGRPRTRSHRSRSATPVKGSTCRLFLDRTDARLWQNINKVLPRQRRRAITAHQVDLAQLRLVPQGDTHITIIEEMETTAYSCGVDNIFRHACRGAVGQRQIVENPIIVKTRGQSAMRTGVRAHPAIETQRYSMLRNRRGATQAHTARENAGSLWQKLGPPGACWWNFAKGKIRLNHRRNQGCRAFTPSRRRAPNAYDPTRYVGFVLGE